VDVVANKFKDLVTAHINSLDPTFNCFGPIIDTCFAPQINDDDVKIVTSNRTSATNSTVDPPNRMLFGNATQPSRKFLHIAPSHAIADTGATSIFIMDGVDVENKNVAQKPLTIHLPNLRMFATSQSPDSQPY